MKEGLKKMLAFFVFAAYIVCSLSLILQFAHDGQIEYLVKTIIISAIAAPFVVDCFNILKRQ